MHTARINRRMPESSCDASVHRRARWLFAQKLPGGINVRRSLIIPVLCMLFVATPDSAASGQERRTLTFQRVRQATVRIVSGADISSGVIVTDRGHVLTVAHGLHRDQGEVTIVLGGGQTAPTEILLVDAAADVAVLKFAPSALSEQITPIPVSVSSAVTKGQLVLAAGCPGREANAAGPVVRLGEVRAVDEKVLRTSCTLTTGDSGGPLVNDHGELLGLHRQIGLGSESNLHIPLTKVMAAARDVPELKALLSDVRNPESQPLHMPLPSDAVRETVRQRTVEIRQDKSGAPTFQLGTLLDDSHLATKLSGLHPETAIVCRLCDETSSPAEVVQVDVSEDIAILKLAAARPGVAPIKVIAAAVEAVDQSGNFTGQFVFAATGCDAISRAGLISRQDFNEPPVAGKLGAVLDVTAAKDHIRVREVAANSTAAAAGMRQNDLLLAINDNAVKSFDAVAMLLQQSQPGDWLKFTLRRGTENLTSTARFQHDPAERFARTEFLDGRAGELSERRTGFQDVLQHDIPLRPMHCGSPLCDAKGQIIAINIARRARESTLAVPIDQILKMR